MTMSRARAGSPADAHAPRDLIGPDRVRHGTSSYSP